MKAVESLPHLVVELGDRVLDGAHAESLTGVRVLQRLSLPTLCELTFHAPAAELANGDAVLPGTTLRVSIGDNEILFDGEVTALRHTQGPACQHEVRVRGYDKLHRLRKRQSIRAFPEKTLVEIARELVTDFELDVHADDSGPVWPKIVQWRQSDLELLRDIASRCGQYFTLHNNTVHFVTLAGREASTPLDLGTTLLEVELDANTEPACSQTTVHAWDPWHSEPCIGNAKKPRSGRDIPLELQRGSVQSDASRTLPNEALQDTAQAMCVAQAELDRRVAGEVVLKGVAAGNAQLRPGTCVSLTGVGTSFVGSYVLTAVTHSVDREHGYRSAIDTSPPAATPSPHGTITTLGHVLDADDPSGLGRVKVSLPSLGDLETDWLEVLMSGAGAGKGLISIPDKDDRVLVLFPRHDPAQGIVLGGLYGLQAPPDTGVENGRVQRYTFMTPGGQRLRLDDNKKTVRVETSGGNSLYLSPDRARLADSRGSYVEMTRKHVRLHACADLQIEAPGKAVTIRGASVDFQEA